MVSNVSYNPYSTTQARESFSVSSDGVTQGVAMDDPTVRNLLAGGYVSTTETLPMWGGIAIQELIGLRPGRGVMGNELKRATDVTNITGFTVYNQAHHLVTFPESPAPTAGSGVSMHFYRLGSKARIPLKASASLVNDAGELITTQVSYDFAAGHVVPYLAQGGSFSANATWASGVVTVTTASAHNYVSGIYVNVAGFAPTGYNGTFPITVTGANTFTYPLAVNPGAETTGGTVAANGGALPVKVLQVYTGNARVVEYDAVNNLARWNFAGDNDSVAVLVEI